MVGILCRTQCNHSILSLTVLDEDSRLRVLAQALVSHFFNGRKLGNFLLSAKREIPVKRMNEENLEMGCRRSRECQEPSGE